MNQRTAAGDEHGYVGSLIDPDWSPDGQPAAEPIQPPVLPDQLEFPAPGIYFGMDEDTYHAIPALSASGIRKMSVSSMNWWANSHLNPDRENRESKWMDYGKAIHTFVLEGEETYLDRYALELDAADFEGALIHTDEIKAEIGKHKVKGRVQPVGTAKQALIDQLAELGERHGVEVDLEGTVPQLRERIGEFVEEQPVKPVTRIPEVKDDGTEFMRPATKDDLIDQLLALDPDVLVWDRLVSNHFANNEGKRMISKKDDWRIRLSARMILGHPEIGPLMKGGHPEVSIFWHCRSTGVPMKARIDRLRLGAIVDLKSFSNKSDMPIDRAIERHVANYGLNVQQCVYDEAVAEAKRMIAERGVDCVNQPVHSFDKDALDFCLALAKRAEPPQFVFVFQQSGTAPVTRGKTMPREVIFKVTQARIDAIKREWAECAKTYGTAPWLDLAPIEQIDDERIPNWATELGKGA